MSALQRVLDALERSGCKPRNGSASCPAEGHYPDVRPSLSYSQGADGVLVNCNRGCPVEDVLRPLNLTLADLFDTPRSNGKGGDDWTPAGPAIARYDYFDAEERRIVLRVTRTADKAFRQCHPDPTKDSGWAWKAPPPPWPLYRLSKVIAAVAAGTPIHLVEGEKDVHTIEKLGLVGTTKPQGAGGGGRWDKVDIAPLYGAHVIVLPDHDSDGTKYALGFVEAMGDRADVRIVHLPGLPDKGDVTDWVAAGGTREQLEVIAATPGTEQPELSSWAPVDLTGALAGDDVEPPTLFSRSDGVCLLYPGRTHAFQGESETCKSWAAQLAVKQTIAKGGNVLYIDFEDDVGGVVARLRSLGLSDVQIAGHFTYIRPDEPLHGRHGEATPASSDLLTALEARGPFALAIVDGVTEAMTTEGLDLISNADIATWMRLIPRRLARTGAAVVVLDHVTKDQATQGRYALGGQHKLSGLSGACYKFSLLKYFARSSGSEPVDGRFAITVTKDRPGYVRAHAGDDKVGELHLTSWPDGGVSATVEPPQSGTATDAKVVARILEYLDIYDGSSKNAIEVGVEGRGTAIRDSLQAMAEAGQVRVELKGRSHLHWLTDLGRAEFVPAGSRDE